MTDPAIDEIVASVKSGKASEKDVKAALEALSELPPKTGVELLCVLWEGAGDEKQKALQEKAKKIPEESIANYVLMEEDVTSEKLDILARIYPDSKGTLEAVILNPTTSDSTIKFLAESCDSEQLELILLDRSRISRTPTIVDSVLANPRVTNKIKSQIEAEKARESGEAGILQTDAAKPAPRLLLTGRVADKIDAATEAAEQIEDQEEKEKSIYQMVISMGVPEKIQFALKGPREARSYLVRDANKVVAAAVLKSPKLNENEIESYAKMRSVSEDVIRGIAINRSWMRKMSVVDALAKNPKTPVPIAIKLLTRLSRFSLKQISTSRDLPEAVRRQAQRIVDRAR